MTLFAPRSRLAAVAVLVAVSAIDWQRHAAATPLDYNRDVRPILSENCFSCHGFDEKARKAKLRLDLPEDAYKEHENGLPIKPGDPAKSEAWQRLVSDDPEESMPPPKSHKTITAEQKAKIKGWIEQGAKYAAHWSFIPPVRSEPPVVNGERPANPVDAFVRARLAAEGVAPSPAADRRTLIRRVALDLTGLPPSAEEVEAFASDPDPHAYEHLVDRLIASPHFGERLALDWLDAARYADTNGFSIDGGRHMWPWRDWVIQAFNDNKRYDRFLIEQLAGDLLPERTEADLIASGFQRNNMVTHEGGTIPAENLTNYNVDRVKTLGESILGLTLGCAQCHNHKFDPITQRDYYQLFAFFNTLGDAGLDGNGGVNPGPSIEAHTVLRTSEEPALRAQIEQIKSTLAKPDESLLHRWVERQRASLVLRGRDLTVHPVKVVKVSTPNRGEGFDVDGQNGVRLRNGGELLALDVSTELPKLGEPITGLRAVFYPLPTFPGGGWGGGPSERARKGQTPAAPPAKGSFMLTALSVTADTVPSDQVNLFKLQKLARVTANSWDPENPPAGCLDPRNEDGWAPNLASDGPVHLTATFATPIRSDSTPFLTAQLNFGFGKNMTPGHFELFVITGQDDGTDLPDDVVAALQAPDATRTPESAALLWRACAASAEELAPARIDLANLEERLAVITQKFPTMVMNVAEKPRDTFILNRGDYMQPRDKVTAGTIAALPPMPPGAPANRLGLAEWLTMRSNPLPARVAVNRFWKLLFGTGLVATPADFGAQGEPPSHPELLDWLAVEFMESGWDVKHIIRAIVTSETYRQSSNASPELLERDPGNRLLARGPRFRLPAEFVRDSALKISGLLVDRLGGPSVNPYTPGDLWREISHYGSTPATAQTFVQDHGEKLYRRSLYTFWKRTAPPPNLAAFDAPNREVCTMNRGNTTTPLQALVMLNDAQFVEAARAFAGRILGQPGNDEARLHWAFIEALARAPSERETEILARTLARERQHFKGDQAAAGSLLSVGESAHRSTAAPEEQAAWAQVAALLLNLSETVTRS